MSAHNLIVEKIRERGPITVADFMSIALYHPEFGYYTSKKYRTGRQGDFFTSVNVGPLFGGLLCHQFNQFWRILRKHSSNKNRHFDIVEVGASNGQLACDVLDTARKLYPDFYSAIRLHLVEVSTLARVAQRKVLASHAEKIVNTTETLPNAIHGIVYANELLDALPVHKVIMTNDGLRECYVDFNGHALTERQGPLSNNAIEHYLQALGITLKTDTQAEVNLAAVSWIKHACQTLRKGFLILIDYGHEATDLYSMLHPKGTLRTYKQHTSIATADSATPSWLVKVGKQDITSHVDLTSIRRTAETSGFETLGLLDQTYFLLALWNDLYKNKQTKEPFSEPISINDTRRWLTFKSLMMPGGLGSTHKVMVFGKNVGMPSLTGLSGLSRLT